ncbi:hypothetical protein BV25DRAFT_1915353 [Artomyces pyxidatus]|uniref:Uncharacterized protein n=1 Tax=Artomyces pyxidatus TaxID=48021 RepID=A0ACB8T5P6_9AGAM|nr:hypothetical protein BV25DRAFT_1915353 [Artomyces pyxidatus]
MPSLSFPPPDPASHEHEELVRWPPHDSYRLPSYRAAYLHRYHPYPRSRRGHWEDILILHEIVDTSPSPPLEIASHVPAAALPSHHVERRGAEFSTDEDTVHPLENVHAPEQPRPRGWLQVFLMFITACVNRMHHICFGGKEVVQRGDKVI